MQNLSHLNPSKKIIRDIVPNKDRVEIPKTTEKDFFDLCKSSNEQKKGKTSDIKRGEHTGKQRKGFLRGARKNKIKIAVILLILAGGIFYFFKPASLAIIKITPMSKTVSVNAFLKAAETGGDIGFDLISVQLEKESVIKANGTEEVKRKASGIIVIYNTFSSAPQILVESTRFETPDGKIYRINKRITVPGAKIKNGKMTPGSIEAVVYADNPGEEYNIEFSDFTIPGFKGTPRYEKFYARSKTSFTGGFSGAIPKVEKNDLEDLRSQLEKELKSEILNRAASQAGEEAIFIEEGAEIDFSYEISALAADSENAARVKEKADFSGPVFKKDDIAKFLIKKYLRGTDFENDSRLQDFDGLRFSVIKKDLNAKEITLKVDGEARFVKIINEEKLKKDLIYADDKKTLFAAYPEIEAAKIIFKPFWKTRFPKDLSNIQIIYSEL